MEQSDLISFTSVVASLLLCKRYITSSEIINFTSKLNCEGFEIDEDWNIDELSLCVDMDSQYSFILKNKLSYDSVLYDHITVRKFLKSYSDEKILKVIQEDQYFGSFYLENCQNDVQETKQVDDISLDLKKESFWETRSKAVLARVRRRSPWYSFSGGVH